MAKGKIELKISGGDRNVAYISLPDHPGTRNEKGVKPEWRLDKAQNFLTQRFALTGLGTVNEENTPRERGQALTKGIFLDKPG